MDIQFGNLEQAEPQRAQRPDQDGHFAIATIGTPGNDELRIYVDLDVMRDMEAHAHSNTRVELGGVVLGQQRIDDDGRPFVVITDCLRALHYEATKGSFKFTHDTWSQITRERADFRPDLEMVGWYHTHPGWSVFLSGMDLFICNHFFNRPLDVALVIDPCADDRGWFQWLSPLASTAVETSPQPATAARSTTARTGGFFLTTGRYRRAELEYFAGLYNKESSMNQDPRYGGQTYGNNQPMVNLVDNRKPIFEIAMMSMLLMQFLLFAVIGWRILSLPIATPTAVIDSEQVAALKQKLAELESSQLQQTRQQAYQEVLQSIVGAQTGEANLVDDFVKLKVTNQQLQAHVTGQMALTEKLDREREQASQALESKTEIADSLGAQLLTAREKLEATNSQLTELSAELKSRSTAQPANLIAKTPGRLELPWWWAAIAAGGIFVVAAALGYFVARGERTSRDLLDDRLEPDSVDRSFNAMVKANPKTEKPASAKTL